MFAIETVGETAMEIQIYGTAAGLQSALYGPFVCLSGRRRPDIEVDGPVNFPSPAQAKPAAKGQPLLIVQSDQNRSIQNGSPVYLAKAILTLVRRKMGQDFYRHYQFEDPLSKGQASRISPHPENLPSPSLFSGLTKCIHLKVEPYRQSTPPLEFKSVESPTTPQIERAHPLDIWPKCRYVSKILVLFADHYSPIFRAPECYKLLISVLLKTPGTRSPDVLLSNFFLLQGMIFPVPIAL